MKKLLPTILCMTGLLTLSSWADDKDSAIQAGGEEKKQWKQGRQAQEQLSPTGRMGEQCRASQIIGAEVKDQQGQRIGKVEDIILNPSSGRTEFAVVSASGLESSATATTSRAETSTTSTATTGEKFYPVPLRALKSSSKSSATAGEQMSFTLNVDKNKLSQGPSFDRNSWPSDFSSWNQRIYSHYGESSRGTAESPGGYQKGTERESYDDQDKDKDQNISSPQSPDAKP